MQLADCIARLEEIAPPSLAESWDNVGLLIGDRLSSIHKVLTCLTLTPDVALEACESKVDLIVTHHPLMFRPIQRVTAETVEGTLLLQLIQHRIAVYSPHTAYDSAPEGINQQIAELLGLREIVPLRPVLPSKGEPSAEAAGSGRCGELASPSSLQSLCDQTKLLLNARGIQFVGEPDQVVSRVGIACGAAAEFLPDAKRNQCDVLITGEARFHACLEARATGIALVLTGHYASERPAVEALARRIAAEWTGVDAWASRHESDPLRWSLT